MMKRYDKYKPSGVEWIGDIPEHWVLKKLKYVASITMGKMLTSEDKGGQFLKRYLRAANLQWLRVDVSDLKEMWFSKNELEKLRLVKDDLVVSEGGEVGRTAIWENEIDECYLQNSVHRVRFFEEYHPRFFLYQFYFLGSIGLFESIVNRISIGHLTGEKIKEIFFRTPSGEEQTAIANYLDKKTAQIDDLIAKKQKLIEALKEERTAIINEAVSGEGKNWQTIKLKYLVSKVGSGITPTGGANVYQQDGIPLLRSQNIYSEGLVLNDVAFISEEVDEQMSNSRIKDGDVLLNITGASIGRCYYVPDNFGRGNVNQHVCIIRPFQSKIKTKYLHAFLISFQGQTLIDSCQNGANREGLNFQQIKSFQIPLPRIEEQENVLNQLKTATQKINNTISKIETEIELIQEYRTAMISEVVTGKIKVA